MVVLRRGVYPPNRDEWNEEDAIIGHGDSFVEAVLDAAAKIDHPEIQAILNSSAMISSLP
jgi:hypothetical protein